ncbi:MAG: GAF domain-containing protein [Chloroflexota bacterium]|nr:MAG: GAF domain-containing protein [Chloroflexota bacterium]
MNDPKESSLAAQLQQVLLALEASGRALLPSSNDNLLQTIVEAAARIFGAAAASIALVDERAGRLVFRVAYGVGSETVVGMNIGLDQGVAGYVANTGQPLAISNVQSDPRFARDTAEKTGYVPRSILAMPLVVEERVIGVMEVLDKISAPSFGMQDMELLALFAQQAALAIHQSQHFDALNDALIQNIRELVSPEAAVDIQRAMQADDTARRAEVLEIARLFQNIASLGEAERRACLQILETFGEYAQR